MPTVLPKENEVEQFFSRIMASEGAYERLSSVLYDHLSDDDMGRASIKGEPKRKASVIGRVGMMFLSAERERGV